MSKKMSKKKKQRTLARPSARLRAKIDKALRALGPDELRFFPKTDSMAESADTPWVSQREAKEIKSKSACCDGQPAHSGSL